MQDLSLQAEKYFSGPATFLKGCVKPIHFPEPEVPEVAFIGRSNVGKSSLINALVNQKSLARTSNTPGRTREINYFTLKAPQRFWLDLSENEKEKISPFLYLVDLPGYGFAKSKKDVGNQWEDVCVAYFQKRTTLRRVYVLIDSRHDLKSNDWEMCRLLDQWGVSYQLVLTKSDKLKKCDQEKLVTHLTKYFHAEKGELVACYPEILLTSSSKKQGMVSLKAAIYQASL